MGGALWETTKRVIYFPRTLGTQPVLRAQLESKNHAFGGSRLVCSIRQVRLAEGNHFPSPMAYFLIEVKPKNPNISLLGGS